MPFDSCSYKLRKYGQIRCSATDANKSRLVDNDAAFTGGAACFLSDGSKNVISAGLIAIRLRGILKEISHI